MKSSDGKIKKLTERIDVYDLESLIRIILLWPGMVVP